MITVITGDIIKFPDTCITNESMVIPFFLFIAGVLILFKGADFLVDGAEDLALRLGVPSALIGLTVVAFGTSLPELVVSTGAFLSGSYGIGLGNIIGSNIANIGLILALCYLLMVFSPVGAAGTSPEYSRTRLVRDAVMTLIATLVFAIASLRGRLDVFSGIVFLIVFATVLQCYRTGGQPVGQNPGPPRSGRRFLIPAGLAGVIIGATLLLVGAEQIALSLGISPYVVGLSLVAVGTSLPELVTSVVAAMKKKYDISVGNILGSNVFNILFIPAVSALFLDIPVADHQSTFVMILFSLGVFPLFLKSGKLVKGWALLLLSAWMVYIAVLYGIV